MATSMADEQIGNDQEEREAIGKSEQAPTQLVFYDDTFVFNRVSGHFHRLNPTAAFALRALDRGIGAEQLPQLLQTEFGIDRETAVRDAELFLNELSVLDLFQDKDT